MVCTVPLPFEQIIAGLEMKGVLVVKNDHNLAKKTYIVIWSEVIIGDELTCVSIRSILPVLSLNNNANRIPGHNTDIGLHYYVINSHTDKPRCNPGPYCMKFPSFIHAIIMAAPMLYMEFDEKCVRSPG